MEVQPTFGGDAANASTKSKNQLHGKTSMSDNYPGGSEEYSIVSELPTTVLGNLFAKVDLGRTPRIATMAFLFREGIGLNGPRLTFKIGRYNISGGRADIKSLAETEPKSAVTLRPEEFERLLDFLEEKVQPLKSGAKKFVVIESDAQADMLRKLRIVIQRSGVAQILEMIEEYNLMPHEVLSAVINRDRLRAIAEFERMLEADSPERDWQAWFQRNDWVLGSDFVAILDERSIDTRNIADYLVQAADKHLDIIEIKRPSLKFWNCQLDHDNLVPNTDLVKAWTQAQNYIFELEREMNSVKTIKRYGGCPIAKPRALLIHGRSNDWSYEHYRAQRLLNGGLSCVQILTYDQVLAKAKRIAAQPEQTMETECPF